MNVLLLNYAGRLWPGVAAGLGLIAILKKKAPPEARLVVYILLFIVLRDALAPSGLWHIGTMPVIWMRFARDPFVLYLLGAFSLALVYAVQRFEPELARLVVWRRKPWVHALPLGLAGGLVVGAPAAIFAFFVPAWVRGGAVNVALWFPILWLTLTGNLVEELLFRGYLQAWFEKTLGVRAAILATGVAFAAAHGVLAAQLAGFGPVILIGFCLYEGLICAWIRSKDGIIASTLAHGIGLFIVSTGIPAT